MHKSIEYGGMTKLEAEARKKIAKTKLDTKSVKYSKSSSFFSNINNKTKAGKPNPNISKLKIWRKWSKFLIKFIKMIWYLNWSDEN